MQAGTLGEQVNPWGAAMFRTLRTVEPQTATEQSAFDEWLGQRSAREAARQDRIHGAVGVIPTPLWLVLFLSAGLVFVYMLFFADRAERAVSQAMLIGSATTVVVATLLAITMLDNPYKPGLGAIEPAAMERTLTLIEQARTVVGSPDSYPCDARGRAVAA